MKTYTVYNYDYFDESIEESNSAYCTLTEKWGNEGLKECQDTWASGTSQMTIKQILSHIWGKEDVDLFVYDNPECNSETFTIYKIYTQEDYFSDLEFSRGNYMKYCPLQERRDKILNELL